MELADTDIVKKPLITEKGTWENEARNRYHFKVDVHARKPQIKRAIERLYSVRVKKVATQIRKGKVFRTRFGMAQKSTWKKAVVQLHEEDRIDVF
jgi:large subunit ribosomal protein L23